MALKQNKYLYLLLPMFCLQVFGSGLKAEGDQHAFDSSLWRSLSLENTYPAETEKIPDKTKEKTSAKEADGFKLPAIKELWIIPALLLLIFAVFKLLQIKRKSPASPGPTVVNTLDGVEISDAELRKLIQRSEGSSDYRQQFRHKYLILLGMLNEKGLIHYRPDKTNYTYVVELSGHALIKDFEALTLYFNRCWYGEHLPDKAGFNAMLLLYEHCIKTLKETKA